MAGFKVSLLTARNNKNNLKSQLKKLNIVNLFDKIHVVGFKKNIKFLRNTIHFPFLKCNEFDNICQ